MAVAAVATGLASASTGAALPVLPFLVMAFGGGPLEITRLVMIYYLVSLVCSPLLGELSDRFGRRSVLVAGMFLASISYLGIAFSTSLIALFVWRAVSAVANSSGAVLQSMATDGQPADEHARTLGLVTAVKTAGTCAGPLIVTLLSILGMHRNDLRWATFVVGASMFGCAALVASRFPGAAHMESRGVKNRNNGVTGSRDAGVFVAMTLSVMLGFGTLIAVTPLFVHHAFSYGESEVGLLLAACAGAVILVRGKVAVALSTRFDPLLLVTASSISAATAMALMSMAETGASFVVLDVLFCCAYACSLLVCTTEVSRRAPSERRGRYMGIAQGAGAVGFVLGATMTGYLFSLDHRLPYQVAASAVATITVAVYLHARLQPRRAI